MFITVDRLRAAGACARQLEDRLDHLHDEGATFAEQFRGRRAPADDDRCGNCAFYQRRQTGYSHERICEVWLLVQPAKGWCNRHERVKR